MAFVVRRCRERYDAALQERREAWRRCGVNITEASQSVQLPAIKEVRPEYRDIHSQVLQDVLTRLDRAFQRFFARVKTGETPGYPRFHGANRYNSFTYKQFGDGVTLDGSDNGFLVVSKIGRVAVRWSRPIEGTPKTVTISREVDGWYVCISCADAPIRPLPATGQETGIDLGIEAFATLSDGTRIFNPGWYRGAERALRTAQRRVSRRKKGSNRRRKAVRLLAKAHQTVRRQRQDFHHKTALAIVRANDTVYHEELQTANMVRNHHLAKSIADAGWTAFLSILSDKAACAGPRSRCRPSRVYLADLLWLWRAGLERLVGSLASLPRLRNQPAQRPQRREAHRTARAEPSGSGGVGCRGGPSISRMYAGECQYDEIAYRMSEQYGENGTTLLLEELERVREDETRLRAVLGSLWFLPPHDPVGMRIILFYLDHANDFFVMEAIDGLAHLEVTEAHDRVLAHLAHPSQYVVGAVLRYLRQLFPGEAKPVMYTALRDSRYIVHECAVDEWDVLGDTEAASLIRPLVNDSHPDVRSAARWYFESLAYMAEAGGEA